MSIEESIYSALSAEGGVGCPVYPVLLPENPTLPAVTYQVVGARFIRTLTRTSPVEMHRISFNCWANSYSDARNLAGTLKSVLNTPLNGVQGVTPVLELDTYEPETQIYRVTVDYECWSQPA